MQKPLNGYKWNVIVDDGLSHFSKMILPKNKNIFSTRFPKLSPITKPKNKKKRKKKGLNFRTTNSSPLCHFLLLFFIWEILDFIADVKLI